MFKHADVKQQQQTDSRRGDWGDTVDDDVGVTAVEDAGDEAFSMALNRFHLVALQKE